MCMFCFLCEPKSFLIILYVNTKEIATNYPVIYLIPSEFVYRSHISPNVPDVGSKTRTNPNFFITRLLDLAFRPEKRHRIYTKGLNTNTYNELSPGGIDNNTINKYIMRTMIKGLLHLVIHSFLY